MTADALMSGHISAWQAATVHSFLAGLRDGSLPEHSFDRWLAQDYLFAQALVRAQSRIAATAPSPTSPSSRATWSPPLGSSAGSRRWRGRDLAERTYLESWDSAQGLRRRTGPRS
jgi:TENA/THI-4/PQQC family